MKNILDIFRRKDNAAPAPASEEKPKALKPGEIGFAISNLYGTGSWSRYNPDELMQNKGYKVYRRMMMDDQVKACLRFKQYSVISRSYYFDVKENEEGNPDPQHEEMADFFEAVISHLRGSWTDKLIEILSAMENGYSITEKVFEPFTWDGRAMWGIRDLKTRPFESFNTGITTDAHGNIEKIEQVSGAMKVELPLDKVIHFVYQPDRDRVFGESDLRACYRAWWSKDITIKFWNIFLERMAGGFNHAKVTGNLSDAQKADLQKTIANITASTGIITPDTVDITQMQPHTTTAYRDAIASHDKAISKSLLVPNLLGISEQDSVGSYSQSQTQFDAFMFVLEHIGNCLAEALNEQLFRDLALWNFGTEDFPAFRWEEMSEDRKGKIAAMWSDLVSKGAVTKSDTDEAYIRRLVGFPEKAEEEEPEDPIPGEGEIFPINGQGSEEEEPDNEDIIEEIPDEEKKAHVRKMFAARPWMRRVNFTAIKKEMDRGDQALTDDLNDLLAQARISIEKQIAKIVGDRSMGNVDPKEIEGVKIPSGILSAIRKTLRKNLQETLDTSYEQAKKELPKKKMKAAPKYRPGMDKTKAEKFLSSRAMKITGVLNQRVLENTQRVLENGIRYDKALGTTMKDLREDTDLLSYLPDVDAAGRPVNVPARLENIVRTNTAYAWNEARQALFTDPDMRGFVEAFEYSAILDDRTSEVCEQLDGKIQKDWGGMTPPNHFQCRSLLIPVTQVDDWNGKEDTIPSGVKPQKGFM